MLKGLILYPRLIEPRVLDALTDTRVVLLSGPRQSGKTTLGQKLATDGMAYITLDNATALAAARADPIGFVRAWTGPLSTRCSGHPTSCWRSRKAWTTTRGRAAFY